MFGGGERVTVFTGYPQHVWEVQAVCLKCTYKTVYWLLIPYFGGTTVCLRFSVVRLSVPTACLVSRVPCLGYLRDCLGYLGLVGRVDESVSAVCQEVHMDLLPVCG